jgi:hypothetical protein
MVRNFATVIATAGFAFGMAMPAAAQPLGSFRWQLQPFCNVITVTVVQQGGQYQLDGLDDQCGTGGKSASVVGLAFQNPDGSIGFGLSIVTAPMTVPIHVDATISIATLNGTWRDSAGNSGNFVFTPGAPVAGAVRPTAALQVGAATESVHRGITGLFRQANGWRPDPQSTSPGIFVESGTFEGSGFFSNEQTAAIWSPGDTTLTVRNGATASTGVLLAIYDEDNLSAGTTSRPDFIFSNFGRAIDTFTGAFLTTGGAWTNASDRNRKRNIVEFSPQDALARLRAMPIYQWSYIAEGDSIRHVGPMAQDFHAAFGLNGTDDTHIATVDADGVVMASVVAVADETDSLRKENARLTQQISDLEARLARIESLLANRPPQ